MPGLQRMGPQNGRPPLLLDQVVARRPVRVRKDEVLQAASRHQLGREPAPGAATPDERRLGTPHPRWRRLGSGDPPAHGGSSPAPRR